MHQKFLPKSNIVLKDFERNATLEVLKMYNCALHH